MECALPNISEPLRDESEVPPSVPLWELQALVKSPDGQCFRLKTQSVRAGGITLQKDFGIFVYDIGPATRLILEDVTSQGDQAIKFHGQDFTESHVINVPLL